MRDSDSERKHFYYAPHGQLLSRSIRQKFDQYIHAFYFDTYLSIIFHLSFLIKNPFPMIVY